MRQLGSALNIRPEEARLVLLVGMLFFCLQAGQGMGDNAASALFFLRFGVNFLPYMYLLLGGLTFLLTLAYSVGLGQLGRRRFFQVLITALVVVLLAERTALIRPFPLLYPVLWLTISGMGMILGTFTWNLAGAVTDARQAKRLFPLFTSAGILGSVLGNSATGAIAKSLGTENLLAFYAALLATCYFLTRGIGQRYLRSAQPAIETPGLLADLRSGFDFVRRSVLMQLVAFAAVLFSIMYFSLAFPFSKVVAASFPNEASVAGFLGLFSSVTTAVTFLVSLLIANRVYTRLGIVNSVLLLPLAYAFGFVVFARDYSLTGAVVARFSQLVILSGLGSTAYSALFNVVPSQKRGQVLAFENGVPSQIGVGLSGVLLVLGDRLMTTSQILTMGLLVTVVCGVLVWRMRRAYGHALVDALRAGRIEVFNSEEAGFSGLQGDAAALGVLTGALLDLKSTTRRLAAEILGRMQNPSASPALTRQLDDPDASVRSAVLRALGMLRAEAAQEAISSHLDDHDPDVRMQAVWALNQMRVEAGTGLPMKLKALLDDECIDVRMQAIMLLLQLGLQEIAAPHLRSWLQDADPLLRSAALETFGEAADCCPGMLDPQLVVMGLQDSSPAIRAAACHGLAALRDPGSAGALVACLHDPQAVVREAAAASLRERGPEARVFILEALDSRNERACDAALDCLVSVDQGTSEELRAFARTEISRLRFLQAQIAGLPPDGRATSLLRETLHRQLERGESRVVKVLGLIGDPLAMKWVRKGLRGHDAEARAAALEALETLGDRDLSRNVISLLEGEPPRSNPVVALQAILKDPGRWPRVLAIRAVQDLDLKEFTPLLMSLRSDPDRLVRETAEAALGQLGEVKPMNTLQTVSTLERVLLLQEVPIFSELSPEDLEQIAEIAQEQLFPPTTTICRQGDEGHVMYIIVDGHLSVVRSQNGQDHVLAERGPGDFVGEMAIIESAPRSATLITSDTVRVLTIDGATFKGILHERVEVAVAMLRNFSRRLREMA